MTSHPPGRCCLTGVKHEGTAVGEFKTIGGYECYISPSADGNSTNAILYLTDALGFRSINAHLIADQLASNGYLVVMPDQFHGDPANVSGISSIKEFDLEAWLSHHPTSRVDPIMTSVIHTMRSEMGVKRLGAVGYCFGGKYTCRFLKPGFIDVGFTAHPSFVLPEELRAIQGPLSIAAAEKDEIMDEAKRRETEDILKEMDVRYQVTLYGDVGHGFAVRGDLKNQASRFAKEAAFYQAVMWFEEFLKE